ncbi:IQ calmodulin-binding motif family protein [Cryptosporidium andersoni]|uniref:IQ calmodulin-binding motif family protein n=1 Tax=Cryptosporidium andersoni TaxID=117008 RepID=A0A1J4MNI9_9CRYT|nr:IQ calmodulin-binding motif family protein [Cryptosporidium andersoni]
MRNDARNSKSPELSTPILNNCRVQHSMSSLSSISSLSNSSSSASLKSSYSSLLPSQKRYNHLEHFIHLRASTMNKIIIPYNYIQLIPSKQRSLINNSNSKLQTNIENNIKYMNTRDSLNLLECPVYTRTSENYLDSKYEKAAIKIQRAFRNYKYNCILNTSVNENSEYIKYTGRNKCSLIVNEVSNSMIKCDIDRKSGTRNEIECNITETSENNNIPLLQCITYWNQERQVSKKLHAVWLGYKTRCIISGTLKGTFLKHPFYKDNKTIPLNICYHLHRLLLSIYDLYELIKDREHNREVKDICNDSWVNALYEQVNQYKKQYIQELYRLLNCVENWVSNIPKSNTYAKNIRYASRVFNNLPGRFCEFKDRRVNRNNELNTDNNSLKINEHFIKCSVVKNYGKVAEHLKQLKYKVDEEMRDKIDQLFSNLYCEYLKTPEKSGNNNIKFYTPNSSLAETSSETSTSDIFHTPLYSEKVATCELSESAYFYSRTQSNFFPNSKDNENKLVYNNAYQERNDPTQLKPRPYLKRKSQSVKVPNKVLELKNITSKYNEMYKKKSIDTKKKIVIQTKIPSIKSASNVVPNEKSTYKLFSRIPKCRLED